MLGYNCQDPSYRLSYILEPPKQISICLVKLLGSTKLEKLKKELEQLCMLATSFRK